MITVIIRIVTMVTIVVISNNDTYTIILNHITYIYVKITYINLQCPIV